MTARAIQQYQCAIVRLKGKSREDEEAITDLLNERARMGWEYRSIARLEPEKVVIVFSRPG